MVALIVTVYNMEDAKEDLSLVTFIKRVENNPCIWNTELSSYSRNDLTSAAWKKIAHEFKDSEHNCREKWRNIRTAFGRSIKRAKSGLCKVRKPYYLAGHLLFLTPYLKERKLKLPFDEDSFSDSTVELQTVGSPEFVQLDDVIPKDEPFDENSSGPEPEYFEQHSSTNEVTQRFKDNIFELENQMESKKEENQNGDWLFFKSILFDFKKLDDKRKRRLKAKFLELLNEQLDEKEKEMVSVCSSSWISSKQ